MLREGEVVLREGAVIRLPEEGACELDPLREKVPLGVLPTLPSLLCPPATPGV